MAACLGSYQPGNRQCICREISSKQQDDARLLDLTRRRVVADELSICAGTR